MDMYTEPALPKVDTSLLGRLDEDNLRPPFLTNLNDIRLSLAEPTADPLHDHLYAFLQQDCTCPLVLVLDQVSADDWKWFDDVVQELPDHSNARILLTRLSRTIRANKTFNPDSEFYTSEPIQAELCKVAHKAIDEPNTTTLRVTLAVAELLSPSLTLVFRTLNNPCDRAIPFVRRLRGMPVILFLAAIELAICDSHHLLKAYLQRAEISTIFAIVSQYDMPNLKNRLHTVAEISLQTDADAFEKIISARKHFGNPQLYSTAFQRCASKLLSQPLKHTLTLSPEVMEHIIAANAIGESELQLLHIVTHYTLGRLLPEARAKRTKVEEGKSEGGFDGEEEALLALELAWPLLRHVRLATQPPWLDVILDNHPLFPTRFAAFFANYRWAQTGGEIETAYRSFFERHSEYKQLLKDVDSPGLYGQPLAKAAAVRQFAELYPGGPDKSNAKRTEVLKGKLENSPFMKLAPQAVPSKRKENATKGSEGAISSDDLASSPSSVLLVWPIFSLERRPGNAFLGESEIVNTSSLRHQVAMFLQHVPRSNALVNATVYGRCFAQHKMIRHAGGIVSQDLLNTAAPNDTPVLWILQIRGGIVLFYTRKFRQSAPDACVGTIVDGPDNLPRIALVGNYNPFPSGSAAFASFGANHIKETFHELCIAGKFDSVTSCPLNKVDLPSGSYQIIAWELVALSFST